MVQEYTRLSFSVFPLPLIFFLSSTCSPYLFLLIIDTELFHDYTIAFAQKSRDLFASAKAHIPPDAKLPHSIALPSVSALLYLAVPSRSRCHPSQGSVLLSLFFSLPAFLSKRYAAQPVPHARLSAIFLSFCIYNQEKE